jgi:ethanolaminephosphotransferase
VCSCIPNWLWLVITVGQFLAYNLDGTDGKQARRTKSSTPLGELFDHGLDSWAALFLPVALFSIFGRSGDYGMNVLNMYYVLWLILSSFIISHWEKYNTGVLFLPWSYDLSQNGMTFLFLMAYLFGQEFWLFRLSFLGNETFTFILEIVLYLFSIGFSVPFSVYNMYIAYKEKKLKQKSIYEGVRPLFSTIYLYIIQYIWIKYSRNDILDAEPRMFFWLTGTLFSNIAVSI